jgi:hypothetical protein
MPHDVLSIEEAFGDLRDSRSRTPAHDLTEMLVVALCAILSGADSWVAIQTGAKQSWIGCADTCGWRTALRLATRSNAYLPRSMRNSSKLASFVEPRRCAQR